VPNVVHVATLEVACHTGGRGFESRRSRLRKPCKRRLPWVATGCRANALVRVHPYQEREAAFATLSPCTGRRRRPHPGAGRRLLTPPLATGAAPGHHSRTNVTATAFDLVGRDEELAAVVAFLGSTASLPGALLLEGEAGIGKTTLLRAGMAAASRSGFRILLTRPVEAESSLSFVGLGDLLAERIEEIEDALPSPQRQALRVALLLSEVEGGPPDRRAVGSGVLGSLRALGEEAPLLLAIDDLQWLDRASATALQFALRRLEDEPIGLLVACRSGQEPLPLELETTLPEGSVHRVRVRPLSLGALSRLLRDRLDTAFARPTLRRIHESAGGNPFFALELGRALERRGRRLDPGEPLPVPADVLELARARLASLPAATTAALRIAAALSQPTLALVSAAAGRDASVLEPAVEAQVVELDGDRIRFTHPLLATAAYGGTAGRRDLHACLAGLVADVEERARHLALAATGPDAAVAAALEEAARAAAARGSPRAASEFTEQAARLTPPEGAGDARRRTADAASYHFESGDSRRARAMLERIAAELPAGRERASVLVRLALTRAYDDDVHAATDLNRQALEEAQDDPLTRVRALTGLAATLFRRREHLAEAVDHASAAAGLAAGLGNVALVGDALGVQLMAEAALGRPEARATLERLLGLQPAGEHIRLQAEPMWHVAIAWMWWEELERAATAFGELIERGYERGDESFLPYAYILAAQNECLRGDFERAGSHADAGREIAEQVGQEALVGYALAVRALVDAHRGRAEEARKGGERALAFARRTRSTPTLHFATSALGLLELSLARPAGAAERLAPLVEFAREQEMCEPSLARFTLDYVQATIELGRLEEGAEAVGWYESHAERLGRRGALAAVWRCRGLLAAARGNLDDACATLERARAEHDRAPMPFERARTLLALGSVLRRARRRREARRALQEARASFAGLGAALWAEKASAELARIGGRTASPGGLTPGERRVAELVGHGRSNKEVATELVVTVRTVESNLTRVYRKLGVRSRAELVRLLNAGDPARPP
jgi:DNA-binding CsgD family transcriptional regulator